ncbi:hypothetical protein C0991_005401 [Blastosporella zonata]|nr:hypothetical protein C0991_005401 [Blastosporella zonata]
MTLESYYIGIDVGTGSARASLVKNDGSVVASSTHDTITYRDQNDHRIFEQSTSDIWSSICTAVKDCLSASEIPPSAVKGLGFDATCSLAVTDFQGQPVVITKGEELGQYGDRNVVLWADHRAEKEADLINSTGSVVLDYVGGVMSLEMEIPKILWLKNHMAPSLFSRCQFFDLPDFLTYRATSNVTRSACSLTCKCSYVPSSGWNAEFFEIIGLGEIGKGGYKQIGAEANNLLTAGRPVGKGLSKKAAQELGLEEGTPVGSGLIDAYAGWLGTVAARYKEDGKLSEVIPSLDASQHRLAAVAGTSTCHLVQESLSMEYGGPIELTIIAPGNRSPIADPRMRGSFVGLELDGGLNDLARKYNVTLEVIALQTRHIVDEMNAKGHHISTIYMSGGQAKNIPLMKLFADTCGMPVVLPFEHSGAVVLGAAMLGRFAAEVSNRSAQEEGEGTGTYIAPCELNGDEQSDLMWKIMVEMTPVGTLVPPSASVKEKRLLEAKYKIFRESIEIQKRWRKEMDEASK